MEPLHVSLADIPRDELESRLVDGAVDLALVDGGRSVSESLHDAERAAAGGAVFRLLLVVEAEALGDLRLPAAFACDFVVRGASSREVAARARGLLWPGEEPDSGELLRVDALIVNLATYQAAVDGAPVDFTYLEYALFVFLVTHPNRAYSRGVLLRRVWGNDYFGGERTVDVHVRRVRAKLGPELSRRLVTVRNVGYMWEGA